MENAKQIALSRAIAMLRAAGCTYAIIDSDGNKHGELEVAKPKGKRYRMKRVIMTDLYEDKLRNMQPGDSVASIPYPHEFLKQNNVEPKRFRAAIYNFCWSRWGKEAFIVTDSDDGNAVEVLRVA